jgi:hypothetical protein
MTLVTSRTLRNAVSRIKKAFEQLLMRQIDQYKGYKSDEEEDGRDEIARTGMKAGESVDGGRKSDDDEEYEDDDAMGDVNGPEGKEDEDMGHDLGCRLSSFYFDSCDVFDQLIKKLPDNQAGFKVKIELNEGYLYIRTVPHEIHSKAVGAFRHSVLIWASNLSTNPSVLCPLEDFNDTSMSP